MKKRPVTEPITKESTKTSKPAAVSLGNVPLVGPLLFSAAHSFLPAGYFAAHAAELPVCAYLLGLRGAGHY
jgi:hypothetical protein